MKNAIFSISTPNYKNHAYVSLSSFRDNCSEKIDLYNITTDDIIDNKYVNDNIGQLVSKYKKDSNKLRWSLKPAIILYFLIEKKYNNVIYIDNDLYFINNVDFLLKDLSKGILLTKHNRPLYPSDNRFLNSQFLCNFTDGFFNAGFIGACYLGIQPLTWWMSMNYWQCIKYKEYGLFDDQKYLDTMALEYHRCIEICDHPGCNLAVWNSQTIKKSIENGNWIINNNFQPIFCHFSGIENYPIDYDKMLYGYYKEYMSKIRNLNYD